MFIYIVVYIYIYVGCKLYYVSIFCLVVIRVCANWTKRESSNVIDLCRIKVKVLQNYFVVIFFISCIWFCNMYGERFGHGMQATKNKKMIISKKDSH